MADEVIQPVESDAEKPPVTTLPTVTDSFGVMKSGPPSKHLRILMAFGVIVLLVGILLSVRVLDTRKDEETKSHPLPSQEQSVTCQKKLPSGDTQWVYAVNNDSRYCASTWAYSVLGLDHEQADPLNVGAIYTLKDNTKEPYTRTLNPIKGRLTNAKGSDSTPGLDSYIPLDSKGNKYVECTNPTSKNNVFKNTEKDITFKVRYKNTGTVDWDSKNTRLVVPNANTTFGKYFFTGQFDAITDKGTEKRDVLKPGEVAEFTATLKLPVKSDKTSPQDGWYTLFWVMSDSRNQPFGEIAYCSMAHTSASDLVKTPALYRVTEP